MQFLEAVQDVDSRGLGRRKKLTQKTASIPQKPSRFTGGVSDDLTDRKGRRIAPKTCLLQSKTIQHVRVGSVKNDRMASGRSIELGSGREAAFTEAARVGPRNHNPLALGFFLSRASDPFLNGGN
jgi:hypothetical protein